MSLNKEKEKGHPNKLALTRKIQDELAHVIQMSLNNIAIQVNNLSKYAEDLFGEISKEVDNISFRLYVLQEQVIQLANGITYKNRNRGLSLEITKSRTFQSRNIQIQQVYSPKQLPVTMCETHNACVQALPLSRSTTSCQDNTEGIRVSPDVSYCFELYKEKIVPQSKEENGVKLRQKKCKDHPNRPESVPQRQLMEGDVSVCHIPAACSEVSHSHVDLPDGSSFSSFQLCEINKHVTRAVGKVISNSLHLPMHEAREVKNSLTYVTYGTGMGEELQPQPQNRLKTKVFVSPTAPDPPPPLPTDWLALLKASKMETPSPIIHFPTQLPSPVLPTPAATSPTSCLPTIPEAAVLIIPPKVDFSTPAHEAFPYYEPTTDDLLSQGEGQGMPLPLSSPITSPSIQTRAIVTDLIGSASVVQSPTSLAFPYARSSFVRSPNSVAKSSISPIPSSPKFSLSSPPSYCIPPPRYPSTQLPRSSTPQNSVPLSSISSCPQTSRSFIPSPRNSFSQSRSSVTTLSRCLDAQSLRPSVTQSQRSSVAQSKRHLTPSQPRSSSLKSPRFSTLQSFFSFVQSPSCISSPCALSVSPSSTATLNRSPSTLPIITQARNSLMEAIRKGVLLHKTKE